mmetsp:Transcript_10087/g.13152  ORF Transcript_10087/g.13152 Transcript_10087/m.13152 type:complete len:329 (-) Transcript_10087:265-1251(-)
MEQVSVANNRQIPIVCPGHSRPLANVHYSNITPDGVFLVSGCLDKLPMLRRGDNGDWIGTFDGHKGAVWSAKIDKDATMVATGAADFSAKLWDAITGDEKHSFNHRHIVKAVEFSPDRSHLATGGQEGILRIFDLSQPESDPLMITQPSESSSKVQISKVEYGQGSDFIATGASDGGVRLWDVRSGEMTLEANVSDLVMDMELSQDGSTLTVAAGNKVHFINSSTLEIEKSFEMPVHFREEGGASLHPNGAKFIAGGSDLWVRVFDANSGEELECHKGHHGPVRCLRYSPDGNSYATGSEDGTIRIWQTDMNLGETGNEDDQGDSEKS